jgi:AP2 domain
MNSFIASGDEALTPRNMYDAVKRRRKRSLVWDGQAMGSAITAAPKDATKSRKKKKKKRLKSQGAAFSDPPPSQERLLGLQREDDDTKKFIPVQSGQFLGRLPSKLLQLNKDSTTIDVIGNTDETSWSKKQQKKQKEMEKLRKLYPEHLGIPADDICISRKCLEVVTVSSEKIVLKRIQQDFEGHDSLPVKILRLKPARTNSGDTAPYLTETVLPHDTVTLGQGDKLMIMNEKHQFQVVVEPLNANPQIDGGEEDDSPVGQYRYRKKRLVTEISSDEEKVYGIDQENEHIGNEPHDSQGGCSQAVSENEKVLSKKRRTSDGCLLPLKGSIKPQADETYAEPAGRKPTGLVWDRVKGLWASKTYTSNEKDALSIARPTSERSDADGLISGYPMRSSRNKENYKELSDTNQARLYTVVELERQFKREFKKRILGALAGESGPFVRNGIPTGKASPTRTNKKVPSDQIQTALQSNRELAKSVNASGKKGEAGLPSGAEVSKGRKGCGQFGPWWNLISKAIAVQVCKNDALMAANPISLEEHGLHCLKVANWFQAYIQMPNRPRRYIGQFRSEDECRKALGLAQLYTSGDIKTITKLTGATKLRILSTSTLLGLVSLCEDAVSEGDISDHSEENDIAQLPPLETTRAISGLSMLSIRSGHTRLGTIALVQNASFTSEKELDLQDELESQDEEACWLTYTAEIEKDLFGRKYGAPSSTRTPKSIKSLSSDSAVSKEVAWQKAVEESLRFVYSPEGWDARRKITEEDLENSVGVARRSSGRWRARLYFAGKYIHIGNFGDKKQAVLAYNLVREKLRGKPATHPKQSKPCMPLIARNAFEKGMNSFTEKWPAHVDAERTREQRLSKRYKDDPKTQMILETQMHVHYSTISLLDL